MKILVTGGRDFTSYDQRMWLHAGLNLLHSMQPITELIEGGANGADLAAKNWALWRKGCGDKLILTTVAAEWEKHSPLRVGAKNPAGAIRNRKMAKLAPDVVLATPGGRGTADMVTVAKAAGLRVIYLEKMPVTKNA